MHSETTISDRRVTPMSLDQMIDGYLRDPHPTWLIDASTVTSFSSDSVPHAVERFAELQRQHQLSTIVAIIQSSLVRMGAATVAMSLRAIKSPVEILVVATRREAHTTLAQIARGA